MVYDVTEYVDWFMGAVEATAKGARPVGAKANVPVTIGRAKAISPEGAQTPKREVAIQALKVDGKGYRGYVNGEGKGTGKGNGGWSWYNKGGGNGTNPAHHVDQWQHDWYEGPLPTQKPGHDESQCE